ncbi:MAG TPA: hypothetical protein VFR80_01750 [Pyrinomonadaceae bacterium]|nr:hypothetical protein [Pyrinomonadaceae bacterium]
MNRVSVKSHSGVPALLTLFALLALTDPANAQSGPRGSLPRPTTPSSRTPPPQPPPGMGAWEFKIPQMEREASRPRTSEEEKLALAQIAEDYQRIQLINNRMMSNAMSKPVLNFEDIAEATTEIKRRANRMKDNLRLPAPEKSEAVKAAPALQVNDAAQMKAALLDLDRSIMSFIKNPIFKNTSVVDLEEATKASSDLVTIIKSSQLLTKEARRLSKSTASNLHKGQ